MRFSSLQCVQHAPPTSSSFIDRYENVWWTAQIESPFNLYHAKGINYYICDTATAEVKVPVKWSLQLSVFRWSGVCNSQCSGEVEFATLNVPVKWSLQLSMFRWSGVCNYQCSGEVKFATLNVPVKWSLHLSTFRRSGVCNYQCSGEVEFTTIEVLAKRSLHFTMLRRSRVCTSQCFSLYICELLAISLMLYQLTTADTSHHLQQVDIQASARSRCLEVRLFQTQIYCCHTWSTAEIIHKTEYFTSSISQIYLVAKTVSKFMERHEIKTVLFCHVKFSLHYGTSLKIVTKFGLGFI
jgi:hypothetical protein